MSSALVQQQKQSGGECVVCLESLFGKATLGTCVPCGHVMHESCFRAWKASPAFTHSCPLCNQSPVQFIKLFLEVPTVETKSIAGRKPALPVVPKPSATPAVSQRPRHHTPIWDGRLRGSSSSRRSRSLPPARVADHLVAADEPPPPPPQDDARQTRYTTRARVREGRLREESQGDTGTAANAPHNQVFASTMTRLNERRQNRHQVLAEEEVSSSSSPPTSSTVATGSATTTASASILTEDERSRGRHRRRRRAERPSWSDAWADLWQALSDTTAADALEEMPIRRRRKRARHE